MPTLPSVSPTALETHGARGCQGPTSIVVLAVATGGLHGRVTASSSPAQLADAMPPVQVQGTSAVAIAQARATLCKAKQPESGSDQPQARTVLTHTHTRPVSSQKAFTFVSSLMPWVPGDAYRYNCPFLLRLLRLRDGRAC